MGPESAQEGKSNGRKSSVDGVSTAFTEKINDKQISTEKGKSGSGVAATQDKEKRHHDSVFDEKTQQRQMPH